MSILLAEWNGGHVLTWQSYLKGGHVSYSAAFGSGDLVEPQQSGNYGDMVGQLTTL